MPKYRKLHTKITESMDVNDMPDDFTRLVWTLLPLALCREGRCIDHPGFVRSKIMPLRSGVDGNMKDALDWFAERGMIERYEVRGRNYFFVPTFLEYQGNTTKEAESNYPEPLQSKSGVTPELVKSKSATDSDTDSDAEADSDTTADASAALQKINFNKSEVPKYIAEHPPMLIQALVKKALALNKGAPWVRRGLDDGWEVEDASTRRRTWSRRAYRSSGRWSYDTLAALGGTHQADTGCAD